MICVNSIKIAPNSIRLQTGKWYNSATVEISPANATCKSVTWSSSKSDIASVNPISGQVLANATGTATIVATACDESGKKGSYVVTVTDDILVTSVTVYPAKKTMDVGDSCYLNASVGPANAANRCVCWHSSNTNVASVGLWSGCVTAVGTGTATIYATACDGSRVFDGCEVTVGRYYKLINKNNSKALSVSGEYLLDLKKERELCLKEQGDPNELVWRVSRVSAQVCCWGKSFINESYVLSITTENKCSVMASSSAKAVLFVPQGNEYYRSKCSENES